MSLETEPSTTLTSEPQASDATRSIPRASAAVSGIIAAGLALGVGELLSGFTSRIPSLVISVGDSVIDNVPGSIERWAIETLGENDKPALVIGVIVICLLIGAATGIASSRRFSIAWIVFGLFGFVGGLAAAADPQTSGVYGWLAATIAAVVGVVALTFLLDAARGERSDAALASGGRRTFVGAAGAAAALGIVTPIIGKVLRDRRAAAIEADREQVAAALGGIEEPTAVPTPASSGATTTAAVGQANYDSVTGIASLVTPNDDFYRIDAALALPQIDVDSWSMRITGMVDNELEFTFDDLLAMNPVEEQVTLSCVSNRVGGDLVGNANWLGVPLKTLLDKAGVQPGATQIVGRSVDGWTGGFPTEYLDDPDRIALVAVAMNGEPLPVRHGFPVRLVIAGLYGYVSATKWLKEIELTTLDFDGYWITRGWSKLGPIKTQSRVDVPRTSSRLTAGPQPIAGVAWAPDRGVDKVEVQISPVVDGEEVPGDWLEAELSNDISDNAWRQWFLSWDAPTGDHVIRVRATDGAGQTQTEQRSDPAPDGATGWHGVVVRIE